MIRLERLEKLILIFLTTALVLGIMISTVRKLRAPAKVTMERFDAGRYKNTSSDIPLPDEKININSASAEELEKIKGIGKTIAERIVEYRYQKGNFASIDDLKGVKGVSVALFEKIRNRITAE